MIEKGKITNMLAKIIKILKGMPPAKLQKLSVIVILAFAMLIATILVKSRKPPKRLELPSIAPLVKVEQLSVEDVEMVVRGYGTVRPRVMVEIVPEVSGKVIEVNPSLKVGGFIAANETLFQIDPKDYELVVEEAEAIVAEAQVTLDLEKAEGQVAAQEWEQLHPGKEPTSPFVVHEPQIRQSEARLDSANAQLSRAKLNLARTRTKLPIDVRIISEKIDLGQYVMLGNSVGAAYGIEMLEIEVPLEDKELAWFDIPGDSLSVNGNNGKGSYPDVEITANFAGETYKWQGHAVRTSGWVDVSSRFVSVIVEVPYGNVRSESRSPLVPGMFVEVAIKGYTLKDAIAVPRYAVHNGNQVWVVNDDLLGIRAIEIARSDRDFVYVTGGIKDGEVIVVSSLDIVTDGMKIRTEGKDVFEVEERIQDK